MEMDKVQIHLEDKLSLFSEERTHVSFVYNLN